MTSLFKLITAIQQKPKYVRGQYAFWSSFMLTLIIVGIWGLFQRDRFSSGVPEEQNVVLETESSFFNELGEVFVSFRSIPSLFKGKIEYRREDDIQVVQPKTIDLEALVASSTKAQRAVVGTTTNNAVGEEKTP